MPATKVIPLQSARSVENVLRYFCDEKCESHKEYTIEHGAIGGEADFAADLERAVVRLNAELPRSNQMSVRAHWVIVRFPDGADLTERERDFSRQTLLDTLGVPSARWAWHNNDVTLSADLNVLLPAVKTGLLPTLRRWVTNSIWSLASAAMDRVVARLNVDRVSAGLPPIVEMEKMQRSNLRLADGRPLIEALETAAMELKMPVSVATLPTLLSAVGLKPDEWRMQQDTFVFRRGRKRRLKLDGFITEIIATGREIAVLSGIPGSLGDRVQSEIITEME